MKEHRLFNIIMMIISTTLSVPFIQFDNTSTSDLCKPDSEFGIQDIAVLEIKSRFFYYEISEAEKFTGQKEIDSTVINPEDLKETENSRCIIL